MFKRAGAWQPQAVAACNSGSVCVLMCVAKQSHLAYDNRWRKSKRRPDTADGRRTIWGKGTTNNSAAKSREKDRWPRSRCQVRHWPNIRRKRPAREITAKKKSGLKQIKMRTKLRWCAVLSFRVLFASIRFCKLSNSAS